MTIYILVDVSYDYYRFQTNIFASTDLVEVTEFLEEYMKKEENGHMPILNYKESSAKEYEMNDSEEYHYWIQEFEVKADDINKITTERTQLHTT